METTSVASSDGLNVVNVVANAGQFGGEQRLVIELRHLQSECRG